MHSIWRTWKEQKKRPEREDSFFRSAWNVVSIFELYDIEQRDVFRLSWLVVSGQDKEANPALPNENQTSFDNLDGDTQRDVSESTPFRMHSP
jgi:hypothetical protein